MSVSSLYPIALTIAGSDSSGGAGIQADLKAFSAMQTYGASVITALTAQNTCGVSAIHAVPADFVGAQLDAVFSDLNVAVVKTGMLNDAQVIGVIAQRLQALDVPLVVDPVMVATSGDPLLQAEAIDALKTQLISQALVITPNLHETAALLDIPVPISVDEMKKAGESLLELGCQSVLVKGGHFDTHSSVCTDVLVFNGADGIVTQCFEGQRFDTSNTHGTGCTLASAIAAGLAKGLSLADAVTAAKSYITAAIAAADELQVGSGHGPVNHFHHYWS